MKKLIKGFSYLSVVLILVLSFSLYAANPPVPIKSKVAPLNTANPPVSIKSKASLFSLANSGVNTCSVYVYDYKMCDALIVNPLRVSKPYWSITMQEASAGHVVYDPNFENRKCDLGIFTIFMFLTTLFHRLSFKMRRKLWEVKRSLKMNGRNLLSNLNSLIFCWGVNRGLIKCAIQKELWTGELISKFKLDGRWLSEVPRRDEFVNNNTIHLVDLGADPEVLINNTTYPIEIVTRTDSDVPIALDKLETVNTAISRDELYALPYDKKGSVIESHRLALEEKAMEKSAHSLAPNVASEATPIVMTTGASNGATAARKRCTFNELITAQEYLNNLDVPTDGRILVLSPYHQADLLRTDENFANQFKNSTTGQILNLYGFKIYTFGRNPKYSVVEDVLTKKALGAAAAPTTDQVASFFFYNQRAAQALGSAEMFYADASTNPEYRRSVVGFSMYHLCLPKKSTGFGSIVSSIYTAP